MEDVDLHTAQHPLQCSKMLQDTIRTSALAFSFGPAVHFQGNLSHPMRCALVCTLGVVSKHIIWTSLTFTLNKTPGEHLIASSIRGILKTRLQLV